MTTAGMIPKPPQPVATITDRAALVEFCTRMAGCDWIAVDTEFLRESTYYPKLCLVQIADSHEIGLIDVLAIDDLSALAGLLVDDRVCKVFHSAEQDLEVLSQRFGRMPAPLFDTQLAAALIGQDDQMGYARLISALLDIDLAKGHTRTDWSRRPLPEGALDYAADDVRYLVVAYTVIRQRLDELDRGDWLDDDLAALADPARFEVDTRSVWRRLKQWHRLPPAGQQVLAELADWRERQAMASDRPRKWVLPDDAVYAIARACPADRAALETIDALPAKTAARHGDDLLVRVQAGLARGTTPLAATPQPPTASQKKRIRAGMDRLTERAETLNIPAAAIASRKEVAAMVDGERDLRLLTGWRRQAAGEAVLDAIKNAEAASCSDVSNP
ncbi:ribonuclease D [Salinisphaera sp. T31B1]|uniref:ribonuclease D n=1 Tax=Salinisphaera sp. T31B1 TaxID=727963 RepID=UPI0033427E34